MPDKVNKILDKISGIVTKIEELERSKGKVVSKAMGVNKRYVEDEIKEGDYKDKIHNILKGKKEGEYGKDVGKLLEKIIKENNKIVGLFEIQGVKIEEEEKLNENEIKEFVKNYKNKKIKGKVKFTTYEVNWYGAIANRFFGKFSKVLIDEYPDYFRYLYQTLRMSNLKVFSSTYVNMGLLSGVLGFVLFLLLNLILSELSILSIVRSFVLSFLLSVGVLVGFYYYPKIVIDERRRAIKNELPFATIHMSAVAGSGAEVISIFSLLLKGTEYKALSGEIKRIMNYVNLFGYNLSMALKSVAATTPSPEFKDLLNGMRSTLETGGDLKAYLKNKAADNMNTYRLERKRYVETISTYSDIYTAILIAAPLLFIIVLVLISIIGNKIGGIDIEIIEKLGIFVVVPALNIVFLVFLNIVQPEL